MGCGSNDGPCWSVVVYIRGWVKGASIHALWSDPGTVAGILGKVLSVDLNVVGFSWIASPAATELESIVTDWLGKLICLPNTYLFSGGGGGVIQDPNSLTKVLSTTPECLRNKATDSKDVIDYKDWQISLSRRVSLLALQKKLKFVDEDQVNKFNAKLLESINSS
ncbi:hypothetical protein MTR67_034899, partial [Solanum verrucosum]